MDPLFHNTMLALERDLQCWLIASDLVPDEGVFPLETPEHVILAHAAEKGYSRIALSVRGNGSDTLITHVALMDLSGRSPFELRPIVAEDVISGSTPIDLAIELLSRREFYFVLQPDRIRKILTRSDLNRLPVRTYLHTLLDHVEGLLAAWCNHAYPEDSWLGLLSHKRRTAIRALYEEKRSQDLDTRRIDCTYLSDKAAILRSDPAKLTARLPPGQALGEQSEAVCRLRNRLGHGMPPLGREADYLRNQLRHGGALSKPADLCWLKEVVATLRAWIDALSEPDEGQALNAA